MTGQLYPIQLECNQPHLMNDLNCAERDLHDNWLVGKTQVASQAVSFPGPTELVTKHQNNCTKMGDCEGLNHKHRNPTALNLSERKLEFI
jgi:hypothetical protein